MHDDETILKAPRAVQRKGDIRFAMERGDLGVVRYLLERDGRATYAEAVPDKSLTEWIEKAEAHEEVFGEDSFLVADHRFNVELLPFIDRQAAGERLSRRDMPGAYWSMERGWHE